LKEVFAPLASSDDMILTRTSCLPLDHLTGQEPAFYHLSVVGCHCTYAAVDKKEAKRK